MTSVAFVLLYDMDQNTVDLLDDFLLMQNKKIHIRHLVPGLGEAGGLPAVADGSG